MQQVRNPSFLSLSLQNERCHEAWGVVLLGTAGYNKKEGTFHSDTDQMRQGVQGRTV